MKNNLGIFLCILGVAWGQDSLCDDIDMDVCRTFNLHVNICADPCLSKLCPRTCDKCPRKCYSCNDVSSLDRCNTTRICPDRTYKCLVHEGIASDFSITYQLGCATDLVCSSLFGDGSVLGRKRRGINGECCNTDLCNKHDPTKKRQIVISLITTTEASTTNLTDLTTVSTTAIPTIGSPSPTLPPINTQTSIITSINTENITTVLPEITTSKRPACADIDTAACQKLAFLKRDMCNDDCLVQACPRTCGKCPECYSCIFTEAPENCTDRTICLQGEKCYVVEEYLDSGKHGYRAGCLQENVCSKFHLNAGNVFGRRSDYLTLILAGDCCNGDLCNHHTITHTTTTTTSTTHAPSQTQSTTAPPDGCMYLPGHHCPTGFSLVGGKCLLIGSQLSTYDSAKISCKYHCSSLMENISDRDVDSIRILMDSMFWGLPNDKKVLIVGAHTDTHNRLVWDTSGQRVSGVPHDLHGNDCLVIEGHGGPHGHSLKPSSCDHLYYYICEANFK